jgi:hypothetical protein
MPNSGAKRLNLSSTGYPDRGRCGDPPTTPDSFSGRFGSTVYPFGYIVIETRWQLFWSFWQYCLSFRIHSYRDPLEVMSTSGQGHGFEAHRGYGCLLCVLSGRRLCDELITRPRAVLPTVARRCVWSRNLVNEEAIARAGLQSQSI